jgi:signal transduction histidine kinase
VADLQAKAEFRPKAAPAAIESPRRAQRAPGADRAPGPAILPRQGSRSGVRVEAVDARMLAIMRCVLALSALVIIWIDPLEPSRLVELTYASLGAYCVYGVGVALLAWRTDWPPPVRALHWLDVAFYAYLVALTEGTSSIFFQFFLFAILVASFSRGFREGFAVAVASFALFLTVGVLASPTGKAFELDRTLLRAVYLLGLGYVIAHMGGYELLLKRRLRLLQEITHHWNPRLGVEHAIGSNLERLLEFYGAASCVLVLHRPGTAAAYLMHRALRGRPGEASIANLLAEGAARALLGLPATVGAYGHDPAGPWWTQRRGFAAHDIETETRAEMRAAELQALANLLDAHALLTVPYAQRDGTHGRIFLTDARRGFGHSDVDFLTQVSAAIATVVENMQLMEQLVARAGEHERLAISRDLHDTTIQPYIGLKMSLDALRRTAGPDNPLSRQIADLVDMTEMTIRDLRGYAERLRDQAPLAGEFLVAAVRRQIERLGRFYGLEVELTSELSPRLQGRLAAEAFQIIAEALSNVLRHTASKKASVSMRCDESNLLLKIGNESRGGAGMAPVFTPRSIAERAKALGGETRVDSLPEGRTVVQVSVPL